MNRAEFAELAMRVLGRWPGAKAWDKPEAFYDDFATASLDDAIKAVGDFFAEGRRFAPTPSELMVKVKRPVDGWQGRPDPLTCRHDSWAIMEYETDREDGKRFGVCAICLTERLADPSRGEMLNSEEREARAKARSADRLIPPDDWQDRRDLD
jgi:hypothetical protein